MAWRANEGIQEEVQGDARGLRLAFGVHGSRVMLVVQRGHAAQRLDLPAETRDGAEGLWREIHRQAKAMDLNCPGLGLKLDKVITPGGRIIRSVEADLLHPTSPDVAAPIDWTQIHAIVYEVVRASEAMRPDSSGPKGRGAPVRL